MIKKLEFLNDEDKNNLINQNKDMYVIAIEFGLKHNYITFSDTPLPEPEYDIWGTIKEQENKISILEAENKTLKIEQEQQNNEILVNMLANTEMFEMILGMMPAETNTKNNGGNSMIEVYCTLIIKGVKTIEDVPLVLREQVIERLKQLEVPVK